MGERRLTIEALTSADGKKRWEVVRRPDGFFVYVVEAFFTDDECEFGGGIYEYWSPLYFSGLFDSAEGAKDDAVGQFPWLRDAIPSH